MGKKIEVKLAKTTEKEIQSLLDILNEIESVTKYELSTHYLENINFEEYDILKKFNKNDPEEFIEQLFRHLSNIHFQRILFNAITLLKNCSDPDADTLEFHPDIKKGLELLEKEQKADEKLPKQVSNCYCVGMRDKVVCGFKCYGKL